MPLASYVKEGRYLTVPAASVGSDVSLGDVFIYGQILGIATVAVSSGDSDLVIDVGGVYDIAKNTSTAFASGARVYWDVADSEANSDTTNPFMGVAIEAAAESATTVRVLLMGERMQDDEYTDSDAVSAMGTKANSNPLNHDRYTDAEALAAAKAGQIYSVTVPLGTVGAGTGTKLMAFVAPQALTIQAVKIVDVAGIAADGTNYTTIALYNETATATVADWSTLDTADGALTALTPASVPLEAGEAAIASGEVLSVTKAEGGAGAATDDALVQIDFKFD